MKEYIPIIKMSRIFADIQEQEIEPMLSCLQAKVIHYKKGDYIFRQGQYIHSIALLIDGRVHIQQDDYWGNRSIINIIHKGEMFGESYAMQQDEVFLNDVVAVENSTVMFFDINRMLTTCSSACSFHSKVIQNMFMVISLKNRHLVQKLGHMSRRSTREKLISYLSEEAKRNGNSSFSIPFNRQQLADYLSVDRSAMSNELCKMRDEGLLYFSKNNFTLLDSYNH
ncbi:MAG: Crp/Fnr family transcriptional regulator [Oscillospiraceae bacterium]|nr:Crp/Fnr family transcriptional regulator [Oscillospiraceae bacterium]